MGHALATNREEFDKFTLLSKLAAMCETPAMRSAITETAEELQAFSVGDDELSAISSVVARYPRPGSGIDFQIASVHMAPCVLWCACLHCEEPRRAIQAAIDLGGDTDTTASMVGAIVGALHGEQWCSTPVDWAGGLENSLYGRDFAVKLAERLVSMSVVDSLV